MSNERRALYPGSFDPPTNGHTWVMERVSEMYDKGFIAIGRNPDKKGRFPLSERKAMLEEVTTELPNLEVTEFSGLYQADFAEIVGAKYIVRGTRNSVDFGYESDIRHINTSINPNIETIFLSPPKELLQVSSSTVMGLVGFEGWEDEVQLMVPKNVFDRIEKQQTEKDKALLRGRWEELTSRLGLQKDAPKIVEGLISRYTEPNRMYHALSHIKTCLNELDLVRTIADNPDALEAAIWFHDAVYEINKEGNSIKPDDEGDSAQLAKDSLKSLGADSDFTDKVGRLILATKHSFIPETLDEKLMVDIDLAILGRSSRLFDRYEKQVREEYTWVPEDEFKRGRSKVLHMFLPPQRENIYQTLLFREKYEEQAKKNLTRSLKQLELS